MSMLSDLISQGASADQIQHSLDQLDQMFGGNAGGGMFLNDYREAKQYLDEMKKKSAADAQAQAQLDASNKLKGELVSQAKEFREKLPGYEQNAMASIGDSQRKNLAAQMSNIKTNANSRGLLYGGQKQGAEEAAKAGASSNIANAQSQINQQGESQAQNYENLAANAGTAQASDVLSQANQEQNFNNQIYGIASQQAGLENQATGGLLNAAGTLGGTIAGGLLSGGGGQRLPTGPQTAAIPGYQGYQSAAGTQGFYPQQPGYSLAQNNQKLPYTLAGP